MDIKTTTTETTVGTPTPPTTTPAEAAKAVAKADSTQAKAEDVAAKSDVASSKADEAKHDAQHAATVASFAASHVAKDDPVEGGPVMTSIGDIQSIGSADESPQRANYFAGGKASTPQHSKAEEAAEPGATDVVRKARLDGTVQSGAL